MHLLYYDEVKFAPPNQESYWLGGVCASCDAIPEIEEAVNDISKNALGSRLLSEATEIHGKELIGGRGNFRGKDFDDRLEWLKQILDVISREDVYRVYIKINPENIAYSSTDPSKIAFMYLVEQADGLFGELGTVGMLFGDYDEPNIGSSVASLSKFRAGGTAWHRGRDIDRIIDTVHFARSHHSRMVQLADVYLYCTQFLHQPNTSNWRKKVAGVIRDSGITHTTKSRIWPLEKRWYTMCWYTM